RVHHELLAGSELALEHAADLSHVHVDLAVECAAFGDLDRAAYHRRLDAALDDERVAVLDLDALQFDIRPDDELAAALLGSRLCDDRRFWRGHAGHRALRWRI